MDDYDNFSDDEDEFVSDGNVYDNEEDHYENHFYGGEDDGGDEEEYQDQEEVEEGLEDEMEDYEDEEEMTEYGEQQDEEDIVVDQDGIEIVDEVDEDLVDFENEEEEEEVEEDVMFEDEEEEEQLFEDEEDEEQLFEDDEEQLFEDDEGEYEGDDVYGNEGFYEDQTDSEDEFVVAPPVYLPRPTVVARFPVLPTRPRSLYLGSESSDLSGDERGVGGSGRNWRSGGDGTATSRPTENNFIPSDGNVVASKGAGSSRSNDSSWNGFQGPICPICYENWTGEGQHCVCCLPCGHLYGLSCITIWLLRPNSQKCPQCNDECELEDVRRLYGMQLPTTGVEELQEKVKSLEAKCASLELKDADWLRKEAEWKKKEADFKQQLNQHKEAEAGVAKDIVIQAGANERRDPVDNPEPSNALSQMKL